MEAGSRFHVCHECGISLTEVRERCAQIFVVTGRADIGRDGAYAVPVPHFFCSQECQESWQVQRALEGRDPGTSRVIDPRRRM